MGDHDVPFYDFCKHGNWNQHDFGTDPFLILYFLVAKFLNEITEFNFINDRNLHKITSNGC